jgi:uridine phosphorylase
LSLPRTPGKYDQVSFVEPQAYLAAFQSRQRKPLEPIPKNIILFFQPTAVPKIEGLKVLKTRRFFHSKMDLFHKDVGVVSQFGFGAPSMTLLLELLIASGAKKFIIVGAAGALQENLNVGDTVLCQKAIRDEGVSYHYAPPSDFAFPDSTLCAQIRNHLEKNKRPFFEGATWTTDALYRETAVEISRYRTEGVLTVDMEASAFFTVARFRRAQAAALFAISDVLHEGDWRPEFHEMSTHLKALLTIAFKALKN